jgi:hypothetical protein
MQSSPTKTIRKATFAPLDHLDWNFNLNEAAQLTKEINIEFISGIFGSEKFELWKDYIAKNELNSFLSARYALSHRFQSTAEIGLAESESLRLLETVFICLRVVKPTRARFSAVQTKELGTGGIEVFSVSHPKNSALNIPDIESTNQITIADLRLLGRLVRPFLDVSANGPENLRRAIRYFEEGYSQIFDPIVQIILWTAGIGSAFSEADEPISASRLIESIHQLIPPEIDIYAETPQREFLDIPPFTIGRLLPDLFSLRNQLVHGGWIPDKWKTESARPSLSQALIPYADVLREAASFILRKTIIARLLESDGR